VAFDCERKENSKKVFFKNGLRNEMAKMALSHKKSFKYSITECEISNKKLFFKKQIFT